MKKLTDREFKSVAVAIQTLTSVSSGRPILGALEKLLANYQEQLEVESYGRIELQRYTEQNSAPTVVDVDVRHFGDAR